MTFAEGCTVFHLSTSKSHHISNGHTWMGTQWRHLARGGTLLNNPITNMKQHRSPGGATIGYVTLGSPIYSRIIIHCTFSSILCAWDQSCHKTAVSDPKTDNFKVTKYMAVMETDRKRSTQTDDVNNCDKLHGSCSLSSCMRRCIACCSNCSGCCVSLPWIRHSIRPILYWRWNTTNRARRTKFHKLSLFCSFSFLSFSRA